MNDDAGVLARYRHGVLTSITENARAYGFSVMITASFGMLTARLGGASPFDVFVFAAGAAVAFVVIDVTGSKGFRVRPRQDPSDVVELGAALALVSIGSAVGAAALAAEVLDTDVGWPIGSFAATMTYLLIVGAELSIARYVQERREDREQESSSGLGTE